MARAMQAAPAARVGRKYTTRCARRSAFLRAGRGEPTGRPTNAAFQRISIEKSDKHAWKLICVELPVEKNVLCDQIWATDPVRLRSR